MPTMPLAVARKGFDHPDWLYDVKWDGFRALAYIDGHQCKQVSRLGREYKSWLR
jgi:ATP-dependent DNA ligase